MITRASSCPGSISGWSPYWSTSTRSIGAPGKRSCTFWANCSRMRASSASSMITSLRSYVCNQRNSRFYGNQRNGRGRVVRRGDLGAGGQAGRFGGGWSGRDGGLGGGGGEADRARADVQQ